MKYSHRLPEKEHSKLSHKQGINVYKLSQNVNTFRAKKITRVSVLIPAVVTDSSDN